MKRTKVSTRALSRMPPIRCQLCSAWLRLGAFLVLLAISCGRAQARTFYVAPNGNDGGNGTLEKPYGDIPRALRSVRIGDTILLRRGRYLVTQPVRITKSGITIAAAPNEIVVVYASTKESGGVSEVFLITASQVTLTNLQIRGGISHGVKVDVDSNQTPTRGVTLRGCRISVSGRDGIKTFNADELLIEGCEISESGVNDPSNAEGIDSIGSHGVTIRQCYIHDTATNGLYLKGGATDGLIEACRIENTGNSAGILLGQETDLKFMRDGALYEAIRCTARNNIVVNTGGPGVGTYSGDTIKFENNTLYNVASETGAGVWVGVNSRALPSRKVTVKNNVMVTSGVRPFVFLLNLQDRLSADNNIYFSTGKSGHFRIERATGVSTLVLSSWKVATRADANSSSSKPALDAANLYKPLPGSPTVDRGANLQGNPTDFGGRPRFQGKSVDIGAHEFEVPSQKQG